MISKVTFTMTEFKFPPDIDDAYATYRMYFTLKYKNKKDGKAATLKEIMPGAAKGECFECEVHKHPDSVRSADGFHIDMNKVTEETWKRVVFEDIEADSLVEVVVALQDVEKDSGPANFLRKIIKAAFPIALDLALAGEAFTIGNAIAKINEKDPAAKRSVVETKFDEMIDWSVKENKVRKIMNDIVPLKGLKDGSVIPVTGNATSKMMKKKDATDLKFEIKFRMDFEQ